MALQLVSSERGPDSFHSPADRYRSIFENARDGIILFHAGGGSILDVNPRATEMLGYSRHESQTFSIRDFPPFQSAQLGGRLLHALEQGSESLQYEERLMTKSGSVLDCEIVGAICWEGTRRSIQLNIRDISRRKRAEGALRESEERMRTVLEGISDYAVFMLDEDRLVVSANTGAEGVLGFGQNEILGQKIDIVYTPEDRDSGQPAVDFDVARRRGRVAYDRAHLRKDGRRFPATGVISALGGTGECPGFTMVMRDFTERKQTEQAIEQVRKFESISVLAAAIAHRFNNLLTSILGNASLLTDGMQAEPGEMALLNNVVWAASRGAELTNNILAYAGYGVRALEQMSLAGAVANAAKKLQPLLPDAVELEMNLAADLPSIEADCEQIEQVIANLVINAAEAINGRGTVQVRAQERVIGTEDLGDILRPHTLCSGRYVCLEVEDSGPGIAQDLQTKIFEPFFTTKFLGRGLGLAAVAGIVRRHRGGVQVISERAHGSIFRLFFRPYP